MPPTCQSTPLRRAVLGKRGCPWWKKNEQETHTPENRRQWLQSGLKVDPRTAKGHENLSKWSPKPPKLEPKTRAKIIRFFPNSWYNYRVLVGYFREFPRRSQNLVAPLAGKWWLELFLTTVTHFEHFLGPRCRTGAGPELGPSLVPNGPLQGAPSTTQGSPREPPTEVMDASS